MKLSKGDKVIYNLPKGKIECVVLSAILSSGGHYCKLQRIDTGEKIYSAWDKSLKKI